MKRLTRIWIVLFVMLSAFVATYSLPIAQAQAPTPQAPPAGSDLGLGALIYQANFSDAKAWPASQYFKADASGLSAVGNGSNAPAWGPSTALRGMDYYTEITLNITSCSAQSAVYFLTRMAEPDPKVGNSYAFVIQCDGSVVGRRVSGGDLRIANQTTPAEGTSLVGRHHIGALMIGNTARLFFNGQEIINTTSPAMPLRGHIGFAVTGDMAYTIEDLRVWSLATDALPVEVGDAQFEADFLHDTQWPLGVSDAALTRTANHLYLVTTYDKPFTALTGKVNSSQYVMRTSFLVRQCAADASAGVVYRADADLKNAYAFTIQCDGTYKAGKLNASGLIETPDLTGKTDPLDMFGDYTRLTVIADGQSYRFFVGTNEIGTVTATLDPGDVGIYASSGAAGAKASINISVKILSVWNPKQ
jgi:hypothetical protein